VPGAAEDLPVGHDLRLALVARRRGLGDGATADAPDAERAELVRAEVAQRVVLAIHVEDADPRPPAKGHDDPALAGLDLRDGPRDDPADIVGESSGMILS